MLSKLFGDIPSGFALLFLDGLGVYSVCRAVYFGATFQQLVYFLEVLAGQVYLSQCKVTFLAGVFHGTAKCIYLLVAAQPSVMDVRVNYKIIIIGASFLSIESGNV